MHKTTSVFFGRGLWLLFRRLLWEEVLPLPPPLPLLLLGTVALLCLGTPAAAAELDKKETIPVALALLFTIVVGRWVLLLLLLLSLFVPLMTSMLAAVIVVVLVVVVVLVDRDGDARGEVVAGRLESSASGWPAPAGRCCFGGDGSCR